MFILAFLAYVAARIVGFDLVNPRLYAGAFSQQHVYNRIYSEILADPELEDRLVTLLGNLGIASSTVQTASNFTVATLRAILPPEVLEAESEKLLVELAAYLKSDRERIKARLDLSELIFSENLQDRIIIEVQSIVTNFIAQSALFNQLVFSTFFVETTNVSEADLARSLADLEAFAYTLSTGQISELPPGINLIPLKNLTPDEKVSVVNALLAPIQDTITPEARVQIETAVAENQMPDAIVLASRELVTPHVTRLVKRLRSELDTDAVDTLASYAIVAEKPLEQVIRQINRTRDIVAFFRTTLTIASAFVMAVAFTASVRLTSQSVQGMLWWAGGSLLLATGIACGVWVAGIAYTGQVLPAQMSLLPQSIQLLIVDVYHQVFNNLQSTFWGRMLYPTLIGVILIAAAALPRLTPVVSRAAATVTQRPIWMIGTVLVVATFPIGFELVYTPARFTEVELTECNGHEVLCSRSFDEVTFAAAHNAMSISAYGWIWPNQDATLTEQLNSGIRALLIDTYYWHGAEQLEDYLTDLPASSRETMQETINKMRPALYREGTFVCHRTCLLGGTPLADALQEIRIFLDENPYEVIVLIIQDTITEDDTLQAFLESGLSEYLYVHDPEEGWLTLEEMIARNARVVVMAEEAGASAGWYLHLWDFTEETPYNFPTPADFTCAPNRGGTGDDKVFFLINHWIDESSPSRVDAAQVNQYNVLLNRVQTCARERGRLPNFIAVDFYHIGDLLMVVDTLNTE